MITVIGNLKGGTGKSTVTFNIAVWLATAGRDVRLFDLDPQKTLSDVVEVRTEEGVATALSVAHDAEELPALRKKRAGPEVLVDVGVSDMNAVRAALALADRVLIPVQPSQADIWSTQRFQKLVSEAVGRRKPAMLGFINRADTHHQVRETEEAEEALQALPGIDWLGVRLYQRTAYRRSFSEGLAVFEMGPSSKSAREVMKLARKLYVK